MYDAFVSKDLALIMLLCIAHSNSSVHETRDMALRLFSQEVDFIK